MFLRLPASDTRRESSWEFIVRPFALVAVHESPDFEEDAEFVALAGSAGDDALEVGVVDVRGKLCISARAVSPGTPMRQRQSVSSALAGFETAAGKDKRGGKHKSIVGLATTRSPCNPPPGSRYRLRTTREILLHPKATMTGAMPCRSNSASSGTPVQSSSETRFQNLQRQQTGVLERKAYMMRDY